MKSIFSDMKIFGNIPVSLRPNNLILFFSVFFDSDSESEICFFFCGRT